ncbi:MAG: hypothetical protein KBS78_07325 [Bacteroidales bacterium]|nr:hypothetical protein [Candidatus Cryptobacteroides faecihippi]
MASNSPNLKVNVGADTSQFTKGMKSAKSDLKDFKKVSEDGLGKLGDLLGINTKQVSQIQGAFRGLGQQMASAGGSGSDALGKIVAGAGSAATGIAAIGIGAAVAGFKLLHGEAEAFTNTIDGANLKLATQAYVDTYKQAFHYFNSEVGKSMAEAESTVKKKFTEAFTQVKAFAVSTLGDIFDGGGMKSSGERWNDIKQAGQQASEVASKAAEYASKAYDVQKRQSKHLVTIAKLDAQIAEQRRIAADSEETIEARAAANARAQELIHQKYQIQRGDQEELAKYARLTADLAGSSFAEVQKANQLTAQAIQLKAQEESEIRALLKQEKTLNTELEKERAETERIKAMRESMAGLNALPKLDTSLLQTQAKPLVEKGIILPVKPVLEDKAITDISEQLTSALQMVAEQTSSIVGELVGDLVTGGDAWGNFANAAISAFGQMAVTVGNMAISTGVATLGIKAALESLNGYAAIAAGVALVALGSAVKAGLSNVASGNYSTSSSVASQASYATSAGSSSMFEQSNIQVEVTGTLKAQGSQLVAVINNENKRKDHTT